MQTPHRRGDEPAPSGVIHVPQKCLVGLYVHASDPQLAANQRAALRHYAENMGWTILIETGVDLLPLAQSCAALQE
jgi:hypothetical protein